MHFAAMYRLHWYRRAFTRYGASNRYRVGKGYFRVNITRQLVLISLHFSCFGMEI